MYTNELLEEKYKAQRQLSRKAEIEKKDYFEIVENEVQELFTKNGWEMQFDERKGGHVNKPLINNADKNSPSSILA